MLGHLTLRYLHSSADVWRARIGLGEVELQGRRAAETDVLREGESLVWRRPPWREPAVPLAFAVLHRDEHVLAVAKPRGLPCLPNGGFLEHTLLRLVSRRFPTATPLHRLGRGTSGIVLFALGTAARRAACSAWREGQVRKEYLALASGVPSRREWTVDARIGLVPHPKLGRVHAATRDGRSAVTHVRVLASGHDWSLVSLLIPTGRPQQIRNHLAAAGHPLVGDPLYVAGGKPGPGAALPGEAGYRLHAWRLGLPHPAGGRLELECAPPPELRLTS